MANNYNVTPQEMQEMEEKKKKEAQKKAQQAVTSVKGVTGNTVSNWAKPKEEPKSYPYKEAVQVEESATTLPTLKSVEERRFSVDNIRTEGAKRRTTNAGSTARSRANALAEKFPEYKSLTSFGIKTPEQYINSGGDDKKYAEYVFGVIEKKHQDFFATQGNDDSRASIDVDGAIKYGNAYNLANRMLGKSNRYKAEAFDRNRQQAINMWGLPDVTRPESFYNRGTQHVAPSVAKTSLESYSKGGNVDLTDRAVFDGSNIKQFGWDVKDGEAVTTLTNTYTNKSGNYRLENTDNKCLLTDFL